VGNGARAQVGAGVCSPGWGAEEAESAEACQWPRFSPEPDARRAFRCPFLLGAAVADPWPSLLFTTCRHPFFHTGPYREKVIPRRSFGFPANNSELPMGTSIGKLWMAVMVSITWAYSR